MKRSIAASSFTIMQRCDQLALMTEEPPRLTRRFLSPPMRDVHDALRGWMVDAGMTVRVDAAGNLIGRLAPGVTQNSDEITLRSCDGAIGQASLREPVLLIGSHLDTVPGGGKYDGVLGVLLGLALVEQLAGRHLPMAIDVIGFSEEEGVRFSMPYLGSRALAGSFDSTWLANHDSEGITMRESIERFGLCPDEIASAAYDPLDVIGFIEPHLEQGPVLERRGLPVGIVSAIVGQSRLIVRFEGEAGHAGTVPMVPRRDALVAAAGLVKKVQEVGRRVDGLRATVGRMRVHPNASNVIPGEVDLSIDVRHESDVLRIAAVEELIQAGAALAAAEDVRFGVVQRTHTDCVSVSPPLVQRLTQAVVASGVQPLHLVSGAGHDAVVMANRFPVAMLFVRHPGGVSHHPDERVDQADVAIALAVLLNLVDSLAAEPILERQPVQNPS